MIRHRLTRSVLLAPLALLLVTGVRAEEATSTIKFSNPSQPGTIKISLGRGDLHVQGTDTDEVAVKSEANTQDGKQRKDGLRVISAASSFALTEKENVITLDAASLDGAKSNADFQLTVPRNTMVVVQNSWGGDITCAGISGDIEINSMRGEIQLDDIAGGVVVGTMNGEIRANISELREGKPLSFTSMNGEVVLRVPENTRANVRLRTQNGSVLTDFEESALVTKAEAAPGFTSHRGRFGFTSKDGKVLTAEIQDAIREATQLSATAVKEALEAVKQGLEEARLNTDEARRQVDKARRDIDRARRDADRDQQAALPKPPAPPAPPKNAVTPMAPKLPIPTISGGKLVTGTLNGGGPEISVSTMNGDVVLRKK